MSQIRRAESRDIRQILSLLEQVNLIHADIRPDLFRVTTKYSDKQLTEIFQNDDTPVFVYENEGAILGYVFTVLIDHSGDEMLTPIKELYIDDLCIDEHFRGQHIATGLYHYVVDFAKQNGCHNVTLNVWEGNNNALAFYRAMGMKPQKTKLETILDK